MQDVGDRKMMAHGREKWKMKSSFAVSVILGHVLNQSAYLHDRGWQIAEGSVAAQGRSSSVPGGRASRARLGGHTQAQPAIPRAQVLDRARPYSDPYHLAWLVAILKLYDSRAKGMEIRN